LFPNWAISQIPGNVLIDSVRSEFGDEAFNFLANLFAHRMRDIAAWASLPNNDPRFLCLYFGSSTSEGLYRSLIKLYEFATEHNLKIDEVYARIIHAWRTHAGQRRARIDADPVVARLPLPGATCPGLQPCDLNAALTGC